MAKSPDDATETMKKNLLEKTGRSLEQWVQIAKSSKFGKHGEITTYLKTEHGLGHGYANLVAHEMLQSAAGSHPGGEQGLVDGQYAGSKAALRPIYEKIFAQVKAFGDDVEFAPKKAYVSVRRSKQFAIVQPSTATRVDVGIQLKGKAATGRLEESGSFNSMVSHRVRVENEAQVDKELIAWLREAYQSA